MSAEDVEDLSREELVERVRDLESRVDRLEDPEYHKALMRQVLTETDQETERRNAEIENATLKMQRVARYTDSVAEDELNPSQLRARYLWLNFEEFSHSVNGGRVVKAGELRRILAGRETEESKIHTSTVGRTMETFVDMMDDIATITKAKDGERRLYVPNDWKSHASARSRAEEGG
ncbi:hypothetical protein [Halomarina oriensis]|uniref:ADF-H domain-containing protein n=1 Tax=Halomarina oriensis TaxID=671145 RepID=A0A6B0GYX2_9EURY|nr:hypothetical protein [Halomarina oriensis]MWG36958.1 hypothetical protein [Halomarina oriensis]